MSINHILNHNRFPFAMAINRGDYWDFHLADRRIAGLCSDGLQKECLISYIDTNITECVDNDNNLVSTPEFAWGKCRSNGVKLQNIGLTGMDNGYISYDKYSITNREFLHLLTDSELDIGKDDCKLHIRKINSNNDIYFYGNNIVNVDNIRAARLNGGFFQGFFRSGDGCDYAVLPSDIDGSWSFEVTLKPEDFDNSSDKPRLGDKYPDNNGIFLYIGTRAENKWWINYNTDDEFEKNPQPDVPECDILNANYLIDMPEEEDDKHHHNNDDNDSDVYSSDFLWNDGTALNTYNDNQILFTEDGKVCVNNEKWTTDIRPSRKHHDDDTGSSDDDCLKTYTYNEYIVEDEKIDPSKPLETKDGNTTDECGVVEIETDNKFLTYDRTKEGRKAYEDDGSDDDVVALIKYKNMVYKENPFVIFNRTKDGLQACDYTENSEMVIENKYDVYEDLYNNALAFQIKEDGSVGYKYFVRNCDETVDSKYKIEREFGYPGAVRKGEWSTIHIRIDSNANSTVNSPSYTNKMMRIMIYVNGFLVFVSKWLPCLKLRGLNDTDDKQEGVPYNISLGGGTQGLCDVVYTNYMKLPEYVLPLEKEFGGSFIGYIKSFKFYDCMQNFNNIMNNAKFERQTLFI